MTNANVTAYQLRRLSAHKIKAMPVLMNTVNFPSGNSLTSQSLQNTHDLLKSHEGATAFIGISDPDSTDMQALTERFGMNELAVEDSTEGHQRAKIDRYGDTYFLVLRPAVYLDQAEEIHFGEIHLFMGSNFLVAIIKDYLRESRTIKQLFERVSAEMQNMKSPWDMVHAALDAVVDGYMPVIEGLENDGDEIEDSLFTEELTDTSKVSQRTYQLLNEVADFKRAAKPLTTVLDVLMGRIRMNSHLPGGGQNEEAVEDIRRFRDVHDHALQVNERIDDLRASLQNALEVNSIIVAERQNDDMKKISGWAAILVAPTVIGSIYGMNFDNMPELHWALGYPAALLLMVVTSVFLYVLFKKKDWM